jgi:hypothetical protein
MFIILDPVRKREALYPVEKLTDWKLFQSLASELLPPNIQIHSSNEADKAARDFAASITLVYILPTRKSKILGWKYKIPVLDVLSKHEIKRRKLLQETRNPA